MLRILKVLRKYNAEGKALRPTEIHSELEKRGVNASLKAVVDCLNKLYVEKRVAKYKASRGITHLKSTVVY